MDDYSARFGPKLPDLGFRVSDNKRKKRGLIFIKNSIRAI